jgi:superfamily I DNA/RNA helicase
LLAAHVRASIAKDPKAGGIEIRHAHALYREIITAAGLLPRLDALDPEDPAFFPKHFPELAADALCEAEHTPWDVVIVDEAQDLLTPEHLDVIDLLVAGGLRQGCWHLFIDPLQNLYGSDVEEQVELRLSDAYPAFDDLFENCRTTRQVAVQTSIVSGIDLPVAGAAEGLECELITYVNEQDAREKLEELIRRLIIGDVRSQDIVILSTRRRENALIAGLKEIAGHQLVDAAAGVPDKAGSLLFSTMHGFKGLERMVVVALDMDEIGEEQWSMLHYAGLSRARCLLYTLIPGTVRKAYDRQARAFGARLQTRPG